MIKQEDLMWEIWETITAINNELEKLKIKFNELEEKLEE